LNFFAFLFLNGEREQTINDLSKWCITEII